jgi:hypothetical protein
MVRSEPESSAFPPSFVSGQRRLLTLRVPIFLREQTISMFADRSRKGRCGRKMPCRKSPAVGGRFHLLLAGRHGLFGEHLARIAYAT